jgi:NADH/NAD ratio-sensing transcriptional regulator Rex
VDDLCENGEVRISSGALGKSMGLTASQIRQT